MEQIKPSNRIRILTRHFLPLLHRPRLPKQRNYSADQRRCTRSCGFSLLGQWGCPAFRIYPGCVRGDCPEPSWKMLRFPPIRRGVVRFFSSGRHVVLSVCGNGSSEHIPSRLNALLHYLGLCLHGPPCLRFGASQLREAISLIASTSRLNTPAPPSSALSPSLSWHPRIAMPSGPLVVMHHQKRMAALRDAPSPRMHLFAPLF
ncbi:hypothetical protein BOTBODRAFT_199308 [Botryobasidium botryosum FD-172 SS1]|uniref:Uncharacterized protein n=1 Tax=Botryobasidium botryosum (strain FD-172 SS1) TaxID=930990 RepID=A0A067NC66_BOTB1|nr:hypothetical protein BOTBODRAFT_199308 [Botryobasidium botryosum FD-172 SS1]